MQFRAPKMPHAPEVYAAVIVEFKGDVMLMARRLEEFGWSLVDATRVASEWSPSWLAAAIVHEREHRKQPPVLTPLESRNTPATHKIPCLTWKKPKDK